MKVKICCLNLHFEWYCVLYTLKIFKKMDTGHSKGYTKYVIHLYKAVICVFMSVCREQVLNLPPEPYMLLGMMNKNFDINFGKYVKK